MGHVSCDHSCFLRHEKCQILGGAQLMEHVGFNGVTYGTMFMKTIAFHVGEKG